MTEQTINDTGQPFGFDYSRTPGNARVMASLKGDPEWEAFRQAVLLALHDLRTEVTALRKEIEARNSR